MPALPHDVPLAAPPGPPAPHGAPAPHSAPPPGNAPTPLAEPGAAAGRAASLGGLPANPLPPGVVRASDADRNETVGALRDEFAAGRLSHDTFLYRMHAAMEARHVTDLPPLLADLPPAGPPSRGLLGRIKGTWQRLAGRPQSSAPPGTAGPRVTTGISYGSADPRRLTNAIQLPQEYSPQYQEYPPRKGGAPSAPLPFPRAGEGFFTIGRDSRCDLAIDHMTVSRIHARLERTPDGWVLKDLSSTNGTRVNGWRVRGQVTVRAGDVVRFGDVEYTLTPDQELPRRAMG